MDRSPVRGAARLAAILDSLPEALLLIDPAGRVVNANAVALGWFEGNGAPLVGRSVTDFLSGFGTALARVNPNGAGTGGVWADPGGYQQAASGSGPERMVAKLADGSAFPAEITRSFLPREHGGLEVVVVRDVSRVADAEQELRRQQKQTELILRAATEGIVGVDLGGRVVLVNPAAARILKYRASELGGMDFERLVRGDSPVGQTLRTGQKHRLGSEAGLQLVAKDGTAIPVELSTAPVLEGESLVGAVVTFVDVSRFRLPVPTGPHAGDADRGMVAAGSVSGLRRPLDAARAELGRLAASGEGLSASARHHLAHVTAELAEASRLVEELLDAATGMTELRKRPAELGRVVHAAVDAATDLAAAAGIDLAVHTGPAEVLIDGERLTQAVRHLLVDTVQASPPNSTVVVAAARRGAIARIEIRGVEIGSVPEHLGFARVVVERHGGAISVHRVEGKGVTYVIELPAGPGAEAEMAAAPPMNRALVEETRIIPIVRDTGPVALSAASAPALGPAPVPVGVPAATLGSVNPATAPAATAYDTGRGRLEPVGATPPRQSPARQPEWFDDDPMFDDDRDRVGAGHGGRESENGRSQMRDLTRDFARDLRRDLIRDFADNDGFRAPANGSSSGTRDFDLRGYAAGIGGSSDRPDSAPTAVQPAVRLDAPPPVSAPAPAPAPQPAAYTPIPAPTPVAQVPGPAVTTYGPAQYAQASAAPAAATYGPAPAPATTTYGPAPAPAATTYGPTPTPAATTYGPTPAVTTYGSAAAAPAAPAAPSPLGDSGLNHSSLNQSSLGQSSVQVPAFPAAGLAARPAALAVPGGDFGSASPSDADEANPRGRRRAGETGPLAPSPFASGLSEPAFDDTFLSAYQAPAPAAPAYQPPAAQQTPAPQPAPQPTASFPANDGYLIQHVEPKPAAPAAAWPDPGEPDPEPAPTQPDPHAWNPGTSGIGPAIPQPKLLVWPAPEPAASELLLAQGYEPAALKAPAQLQAVGHDRPVALLADPVGVPVTRAALHTLRAAAADSGIPLFVTAGLGAVPAVSLAANRRGADPSALLRALTPEQVPHPRVLLIEENPDLAAAFAVSLERDGMRVIQATTENDALSSLSAEHPQLVVMNLTLVRRRRSGVVDWLRAYERLHLAPTVLYTAPVSLTSDAELMRALRSGAAAVHLTDRETGQEAANRLLDLMGKVAD